MLKNLLQCIGTILLFTNIVSAQTDTRITGLTGIDDSEGITHLIYPTGYHSLGSKTDSILCDYYVFNTQTGKEKLLYHDYTIESTTALPPGDIYGESVADYKFFGNDPDKFICAYNGLFGDAYCYISRYDTSHTFMGTSFIKALHISCVDTNIVYACFGNMIIKSTDGGRTWPAGDDTNNVNLDFEYIQHSPFDDNIIYGCKNFSLYKSIDGGKTANSINFILYGEQKTELFFDKDRSHIYLTDGYNICVSDSNGEPGSWTTAFESDIEDIFMVYDSTSGNIYFTMGKELYKSTDRLTTYNFVHEFPEKIYGIYKKPGEEKIFVAFNSRIEEFDFQQSKVILRKSISQSLQLFPLSIGNEWVYKGSGASYDILPRYFSFGYKNKIVSDTLTTEGLRYFKFLYNPSYGSSGIMYTCWLRVDTLKGKIYKSYAIGEDEVTFFDLLAHGDMFCEPEEDNWLISTQQSDTILWNKRREVRKYNYSSLDVVNKNLCQGIGLIEQHDEFDFGYANHHLQGCVINNVIYGDTVLVNIKDNIDNLPDKFSLMQNYPNPFNPVTVISYQLAVFSKTTLKIYDILGRELATLVDAEQKPGTYKVEFDGSNLASGVYFYQLKSGNLVQTRKMTLLK